MPREEIDKITEELRLLMVQQLGIRANSFAQAVRRAGRLLPGQARIASHRLLELKSRATNPKLAARTDPSIARNDAAVIKRHLKTITAGERQARERAFFFAEIAFRVAIVLTLLIAILAWRGII